MKILVVNVNTSKSMTDVISEAARRYASPGTAVVALRPYFGAEAVDCNFESYLSAVAVMDRVMAYDESYDAVILAGFGEHGRDGLQELIEQPVVEICEASAHVAMMIGHAYSVVTTLQRSVPAIEDRLRLAGLWDRCASVRASGMSTLEVDADPKDAVRAIVAEARRAVEADHAEVICLGCAGMAGLEEAITTELGVPVIDGIGAAVRLAEALVGLGLKTSKISTYAPPDVKKIAGWPLWQALGVPRRPVQVMRPALPCDQGGTMTPTDEQDELIQRPRPGAATGSGPVAPEIDLASRWLGSNVVAASDESFGDKENLLTPDAPAFEPGQYGNRGEIVDGWETRRRRDGGHDWVVVRLGTPGVITSVDVDTSFFTGNYPESCSVEACGCEGYPGPAELTSPAIQWVTIVPKSPLRGDEHNRFEASDPRRFTHVRLSILPDGGIARLRVVGRVVPDPRGLEALTIDLASQEYGGAVVGSSDDFYTAASMLNRPGRSRSMGEGWETRRRRDAGCDHVVFRLAFPGVIRRIVVDTAHFRYNASAEVALYGCAQDAVPPSDSTAWLPLLGRTRLQPDTRHEFASQCAQPVVMIRLDAIPDGGLSRVRLIGSIEAKARRAAGYRWFNSLPAAQAVQCLVDTGMSSDLATEIERQRPLNESWLLSEHRHLADDSTTNSYRALASMIEGKVRLTAPTHDRQ